MIRFFLRRFAFAFAQPFLTRFPLSMTKTSLRDETIAFSTGPFSLDGALIGAPHEDRLANRMDRSSGTNGALTAPLSASLFGTPIAALALFRTTPPLINLHGLGASAGLAEKTIMMVAAGASS